MVDIRVLDDRILAFAPEPPEERTASGFYVPSTAQGNVAQAEVVKTGPGRMTDGGALVRPVVKTGDKVLIYRQAGTSVTRDGQEYRVLAPNDIIAVIDPED
jgi:chaperonin GroES